MKLMNNLVISVPRLEIHRPPISTAIVANVIQQAKHPVQALDLNIKFFHHIGGHTPYYEFDQIWDGERPITKGEEKTVRKFIASYSEKYLAYDRIWISVFGGSCHLFTEYLCEHIRKLLLQFIIADKLVQRSENLDTAAFFDGHDGKFKRVKFFGSDDVGNPNASVSYTHLTLPTKA